jgi:hypothetical protein
MLILQDTALLPGLTSPPFRLGQVAGLAVDYRYWSAPLGQSEKLSGVIYCLLEEGLKPEDLVYLSTRRFPDSAASRLSCRMRGVEHAVVACELRDASAIPTGGLITLATLRSVQRNKKLGGNLL